MSKIIATYINYFCFSSFQLQHFGFNLFHGLDGSTGMLEIAKNKQLYQELKQCMLGEDSLPFDSGKMIVVCQGMVIYAVIF